MSAHYTEADVQAAMEAALLRLHWHPDTVARDVLDAVAPAIAARALREFAGNHVAHQSPARMQEDLRARAEEIEAAQ